MCPEIWYVCRLLPLCQALPHNLLISLRKREDERCFIYIKLLLSWLIWETVIGKPYAEIQRFSGDFSREWEGLLLPYHTFIRLFLILLNLLSLPGVTLPSSLCSNSAYLSVSTLIIFFTIKLTSIVLPFSTQAINCTFWYSLNYLLMLEY